MHILTSEHISDSVYSLEPIVSRWINWHTAYTMTWNGLFLTYVYIVHSEGHDALLNL